MQGDHSSDSIQESTENTQITFSSTTSETEDFSSSKLQSALNSTLLEAEASSSHSPTENVSTLIWKYTCTSFRRLRHRLFHHRMHRLHPISHIPISLSPIHPFYLFSSLSAPIKLTKIISHFVSSSYFASIVFGIAPDDLHHYPVFTHADATVRSAASEFTDLNPFDCCQAMRQLGSYRKYLRKEEG